jgi:hypothetical protein
MSQTPRRRRNSCGEFVKSTEDQVVATVDRERETTTLAKKPTKFGALFALRNWQAAVTPNRTQIIIWPLIMITKFLSMLSITSFWLCSTIAVKTLPSWAGPTNIFDGYMRRRAIIEGGNQVDQTDHILADIFPPVESFGAYNLKIALTETARQGAPVICELAIPLLFRHPLVWASLAALSLSARYFLSFTHDCLQRAYRTTTSKHHSS